jgi:SagB-type dehydrogenase family enzyme
MMCVTCGLPSGTASVRHIRAGFDLKLWFSVVHSGCERDPVDSYATSKRTSAGARHALETYLLVNNVAELRPGLYRFLATAHRLAEVDTADGLADKMTAACWEQSQVRQSAVTFLWVAIPYRMTWRYGERGYRYLHLDAGHVCQNLYLAAEVIGAGVCAIAAFQDQALNSLLDLDGERQFVIYLATVGKKHAPSVA